MRSTKSYVGANATKNTQLSFPPVHTAARAQRRDCAAPLATAGAIRRAPRAAALLGAP